MQLLGLPKDHDHDSCVKTIEDISQAFPWYTFLFLLKIQIGLIAIQQSTIDVITLIPYETFEEWAGTMEKKEETLMKLKRRNCAAFIKRSLQTITTSRR
jgi:all-trans-retinol 13,14-reductase